jgi:hypothetical protein
MAKAFELLQKKRPGEPYGRQGWSVIDAPRLGYPLSGCVPAIPTLFHRATETIYDKHDRFKQIEESVSRSVTRRLF